MRKNNKPAQTNRHLAIGLPQEHYDLIERMADGNRVSKVIVRRDVIRNYLEKDYLLFGEAL
jgi:hypothetical protein